MIPHWTIDDYLHPIYPNELKVKDNNDNPKSGSSIALYFKIDKGWKLKTKLYDKRDEFTFPIINFPYICISALPVYEVYISHSYAFLWNVRSIVTYRTQLRNWYKSYLNKATLLLCWSHCYKCMSSRSFPFYVDYVFRPITDNTLTELDIYIYQFM